MREPYLTIADNKQVKPAIQPIAPSDLKGSLRLDRDRRLRGENALGILDQFLGDLDGAATPKRKAKAKNQETRERTVEVLLANIISAANNRLRPNRFVAVPFSSNAFVGTGLGLGVMQATRDLLKARGLIQIVEGYHYKVSNRGGTRSSVTRLRATHAFRDFLSSEGVGRRAVTSTKRDLIKLKDAEVDAGPEPDEVRRSREVLIRVNARLSCADIALPDEAWVQESMAQLPELAKTEEQRRHDQHAGDVAATAIYRVFNYNWGLGGRLYGGWWQNVSKAHRPRITIDDAPTIELDYAQMHPSILLSRVSSAQPIDVYNVPGWPETTKPLGKDTFNRLLNKMPIKGSARTSLARVTPELRHLLPPGRTFKQYLSDYLQHTASISHWFYRGEGLRLQANDSELALSILDYLDSVGITALPIHDSFIVKAQHEATLRETMFRLYLDMFGTTPTIR